MATTKKEKQNKSETSSTASISYPVLNASGKEVGSVDLDGAVFAAPVLKSIVFDAVMWQLSKRRQGTHSTISKGVMKGGNRKPWRQKGTGRARAGSNTSPVWVGGAVAHGPKSNPFGYELRTPKRTRRQALAAALSDKVSNKCLIVLDSLAVASGKTKDMRAALKALGLEGKKIGMLVDSASTRPSGWSSHGPEVKAARNIERLELFPINGVNVKDVLKAQVLVAAKDHLLALQKEIQCRGTCDR